MLGGFTTERVGTVVVHGFLAFVALRGLLRLLLGAATAMLAHAVMDATAMLFQMKLVTVEAAALVFLPLVFLCAIPFYRYGRKQAPSASEVLAGAGRVLYISDSQAKPVGPSHL